MRYHGLDLNLLVALEALLDTRSVSKAAARLNLSQPAMSAALSRLRDYFHDDLLVVCGRRMYPTAYAEQLAPELKDRLADLGAMISGANAFDPTASHRTFRIMGSDYVTATVLAPLVQRLAEAAPGVRLDIAPVHDDSAEQLAEGQADLLLAPDGYVHPDHPAELLLEELHVVLGWSGNPVFRTPLTEEAVFGCGHVAVAMGRDRTLAFADRELAIMGKDRRVEVTAGGFLAVPWLLQGTGRLAFVHQRLAVSVAKMFSLNWRPIPFPFPVMREMAQHHRTRSADAGLAWLRRELARAAAGITVVDRRRSKQ